jgi:acyl-coenzyme A thioesterase PaaI-like protein
MPTRRERLLFRVINFYPPYLGAGVRVVRGHEDDRTIRVEMRLRPWNRNLFGTHFGGSLYSMCDPWYVFLLVRYLGEGYLVWDKAAAIEFLKPGRGRVTATFHVTPEAVDEIRAAADRDGKTEPVLTVEVVGEDGEIVARVKKTLWVKKKGSTKPAGNEEPAPTSHPSPAGPERESPGAGRPAPRRG